MYQDLWPCVWLYAPDSGGGVPRFVRDPQQATAAVVVVYQGGRPRLVLGADHGSRGAAGPIGWADLARAVLEDGGYDVADAPRLQRFLERNVLRLSLPGHNEVAAHARIGDETQSLFGRYVAEGEWRSKVWDLDTALAIGGPRSLTNRPAASPLDPARIGLRTRFQLSSTMCDIAGKPDDIAEEVRLWLEIEEASGVPISSIEWERGSLSDLTVNHEVCLAEAFRRAEADEHADLDWELESLAGILAPDRTPEGYEAAFERVQRLYEEYQSLSPQASSLDEALFVRTPLIDRGWAHAGFAVQGFSKKHAQRILRFGASPEGYSLDQFDEEADIEKVLCSTLESLGLLETPTGPGSWTTADEGRVLGSTHGAAYTREGALRALDGLVRRASAMNADDTEIYRVTRLVLFGSLARGAVRVGDADVQYSLEPRVKDPEAFRLARKETRKRLAKKREWMVEPAYRRLPETDFISRLRNGSPILSLMDTSSVTEAILGEHAVALMEDGVPTDWRVHLAKTSSEPVRSPVRHRRSR